MLPMRTALRPKSFKLGQDELGAATKALGGRAIVCQGDPLTADGLLVRLAPGASMNSVPNSHSPDDAADGTGSACRNARPATVGAGGKCFGRALGNVRNVCQQDGGERARWAVDARRIDDADLHSVGRTGSQPGPGPGCLFPPGRHPGAETGRSDASSASRGTP